VSSRKAFDGSVGQFRIRRGEAVSPDDSDPLQSSFLIRRIGFGAIARIKAAPLFSDKPTFARFQAVSGEDHAPLAGLSKANGLRRGHKAIKAGSRWHRNAETRPICLYRGVPPPCLPAHLAERRSCGRGRRTQPGDRRPKVRIHSPPAKSRTNLYRLSRRVSETSARFIGRKRCDVSVVVVGSTRLMAQARRL
jgi:hypothetical protein